MLEFKNIPKERLFKAMRVVAVLALASTVFVVLIVLRPKAEREIKTDAGFLVEVMPAQAEDVFMTIETYGTVKPRETLKLVAEVRGQIVNMHRVFKEGGFAPKETILMNIDPRTYQLEVERRKVQIDQINAEFKRLQQEILNAQASIRIARSDTDLARNEFARLKELMHKNVVAQTTFEKAEQRYLASLDRLQKLENQLALIGPLQESLKAQREMAGVMLQQAKIDLERASIIAPFDAWVLVKAVEAGQHVNAGQYLGEIYAAGALDVEVNIPVKDLKWFPPDLNTAPIPEVDIIFSGAQSTYRYKGRVARTKAHMDEKTRTLPVVVEVIENDSEKEISANLSLRPGMFVTVNIKGEKMRRVFVLPRHMVHDGDVVFTVESDRLKIKSVRVRRRFKDKVFIDQGLSDGQLLIKTPISSAVEGMRVRLNHDRENIKPGSENRINPAGSTLKSSRSKQEK